MRTEKTIQLKETRGRQGSKVSNRYARDDHDNTTWQIVVLETSRSKENGKKILINYTTLNNTSKNGKVSSTAVSNTRSK